MKALTILALTAASLSAQEPVITVDGQAFESWQQYTQSDLFQIRNLRCQAKPSGKSLRSAPSDCSFSRTNILPQYQPTYTWRIPVVVHVIRNSSGSQGNVTMSKVQSQIQILNEDFRALAGSNGANGTDTRIEFFLATTDPSGNATSGVTYSNNTTWFNDGGSYWNTLAWDTNRYLNIYTNQASGALGYVPDLPQGGIAGQKSDRVVVLWSSFGLNGPIGPPFNKGRTTTHEVGHYLGLYHTFDNGCGSSNCYTTGDRICDTNGESSPNYGCGSPSSCGSSDPVHNYMDYSDDLCMWEFTPEQANRMRCSLEEWRPNLGIPGALASSQLILGSGMNPQGFAEFTPPVIGTTWWTSVALAGGTTSLVGLSANGTIQVPTAMGELLILPPLLTGIDVSTGTHAIAIPNDSTLIGQKLYTQAAAGFPVVLQNGIELTFGL